jgi:hypothetical protein
MSARPHRRLVRLALALALAIVLGTVQSPPAARADPSRIVFCWWTENPFGGQYLECRDLWIPFEVAPPWGDCWQCGLAIELEQVINPSWFRIAMEHFTEGLSLWSGAAATADPVERTQLRNEALDHYTDGADILFGEPAVVTAFGLIDTATEQLYSVSDSASGSWTPRPDPWGPRPEPWRWPQLIADAITDIEVGLFNPGQMPQQRVIAAQHLDEAYEDLLSVMSGQL